MGVLAWITGVIIVIAFGMAGVAKVTWQQRMADAAEHLGYTQQTFRAIGGAEILGGIGVILGLAVEDLEWVAIGAAIGLAIVGFGAANTHRNAGDETADAAPALVLGVLAVVCALALTLR